MEVEDFANKILYSPTIEDKLFFPIEESWQWDKDNSTGFSLPQIPLRDSKIAIKTGHRSKFPTKNSLKNEEKRAQAFHFFANHELLAIEMMAATLLRMPHQTLKQKKMKVGILKALSEEQKHFKLYQAQMNKVGLDFGDLPLNDFFWKMMKDIDTFDKFFAVMSLTFEAANLDFLTFYKQVFTKIGDNEAVRVLEIVYQDEISHVALGNSFLFNDEHPDDFSLYQSKLPFPITPARGKGKVFDRNGRQKAGLSRHFIDESEAFQDDYRITKRKEWQESEKKYS